MKQISVALGNIIGGSSSGTGNDNRAEDFSVKKGVRGALAAVTGGKGTGRSVVPYKKGGKIRPEQIIPMEEGQFKDF
jgi:hypothetical protein